MRLTEEQLKELRQQAARPARNQSECLPEEIILQAATKDLSEQERQRVVQHLRVCPDCARNYRVAHHLKPLAGQAPSPIAQPAAGLDREASVIKLARQSPFWAERWKAFALAATVLIAVGLSLALWRATERAPEPGADERGAAPLKITVQPSNGALLTEAPRELSWSAVESAENYKVSLYDFESTPVWESAWTSGTSVTLPEPIRQRLNRGQRYYWQVIARRGIERFQSEVFQFALATDE